MKRLLILGFIVAAGSITLAAYQAPAQPPAQSTKPIEVVKIADNLFVLTTSNPTPAEDFSGGNVSIFITDAGVTLIDTKLATWGNSLLAAVKKVTAKPVVRIINTHTHGDHTGNDDKFGDKVEIVAHENTKANMEKMDAFKGANAKFLPGKTYKDKMTLGSGKDQIDLMYFGPGHTSGDTWVWFKSLNVLATGDMFAWKDGPRIDPPNGGSGIHYAETLGKALKGVNNITTVIPGHSPLMKIADLAGYQKFVADLIASTTASHKAGKTVDEAFAAFDVSKYPGYKNERVKASMQVIYDELKK